MKKIEKKILMITNQFYPDLGGIQRFSTEFADFLSFHFDNVHVCALRTQSIPTNTVNYKFYNILFPIEFLKNSVLYFLLNSLLTLYLVIKVRPNIIICANYLPISILTFLPSLLFRNIKCIVYTHGSEFLEKQNSWMIRNITNLTDKEIDVIIYNSTYSKQIANERNIFKDIKKSMIIHPIFPKYVEELNKNASKFSRSVNRPINFITVCRIVKKKGIEKVIETIYKINPSTTEIKYTIIGDGDNSYNEELKDMVRNYKLNDIIEFKGRLSDKEVYEELMNSDVFIMPSYFIQGTDFESFGIVYIEALVSGLHVLISTESGAKDLKPYFPDQITLIDPNNIELVMSEILTKDNFKENMELNSSLKEYLELITKKWVGLIDDVENN